MENLEIIFFLLLSAVLLVGLAQKIHIPYPIILILGGAALAFIPGIDNIYFEPNLYCGALKFCIFRCVKALAVRS